MTNTRKALEMAIRFAEANISTVIADLDGSNGLAGSHVLYACQEALAQPAQDLEQAPCEQPVAWLYKRENSSGGWYVVTNYEKENDNGSRNIECYDIPLYTHPAPSCNCKDKK